MATTTIERPEAAAAERVTPSRGLRWRRRWSTPLGAIAVAAVVTALWVAPRFEDGDGSNSSRGMDASSARLEGAADAYFENQASIQRGLDAWSARLEGAADAYLESHASSAPEQR